MELRRGDKDNLDLSSWRDEVWSKAWVWEVGLKSKVSYLGSKLTDPTGVRSFEDERFAELSPLFSHA